MGKVWFQPLPLVADDQAPSQGCDNKCSMILLREENVVAIDLITQHIRMKLQQPDLRRIYHNLEVVPSNYQTRGMHTIIRDVKTNKTDFVFYADRLLRLVSHNKRSD